MKKFVCLLAVLSLSLFAQETFPLFQDSLTFYQGFNNGTDADLSIGNGKVAWTAGKLKLEEGRHGKAILCGREGMKLTYYRKDNLNFDKPGTIVFFYRPLDWNQNKKFSLSLLWAIESEKGYIGLQGANDPKNIPMSEREFYLYYLYGKRLPNKAYHFPPTGAKGGEGWHMMAFTWAGAQITIHWDQSVSRSYSLPFPMKDSDFPANHFSFGSFQFWNYLLDDFMIYNRRLSDEELNQLYSAGMKGVESGEKQ